MADHQDIFQVYLEEGKKKTFACAVDWPGWCRSGRDETSALQALLEYGPRYAQVVQQKGVDFKIPAALSSFQVLERLEGDPTTDFGAPGIIPACDFQPAGADDLQRLRTLLEASWQAFDSAAQAGAGKELRLGPRGGGRQVDQIIEHVLGAEFAYLSQLGKKMKIDEALDPPVRMGQLRRAILETLTPSVLSEIPERGPRGSRRWPARYFVRRTAWHSLDHAWEIEDRAG